MRKREISLKNFILAIDEKYFFNLLRFINFFLKKFKIHIFLNNRKKFFFNTSYLNYNNNIFTKLCDKYMTDKGSISHNQKFTWYGGPHSYSNYYFSIFNHFKDDVKLLFECGLGLTKTGASLRVWRDYFKNAQIYGADINKNILFQENRIKTFYVDQLNTPSIELMWKEIGIQNFDIIIDDGRHTTDANINLFINSFDKLKKNGIYIIEDVDSKEFNNIMKKLEKFNPELIVLGRNNLNCPGDNNLLIIRNI